MAFSAATWTMIGTVASVAGTVLSAVSSIEEGRSQNEMAEYNAAVAREDKKAAVEAAAYEELRQKDEARRLKGRMLALYGKSGVTMTGTPLEVMAESAEQAELDTLAIRRTGATAASRSEAEAQLESIRGRSAQRASYYKAGTSLLSGGSKLALMR